MPLRQPATKPGTSQDVHGNYGPVGKRFIPLFPRISSSPLILNLASASYVEVRSVSLAFSPFKTIISKRALGRPTAERYKSSANAS